jgi:hypothetical protein
VKAPRCRKGFHKKTVKGKRRCAKVHKHRRHQRKHHPAD